MSDRHLAVKTEMRANWISEGKLEWVAEVAEIKKSFYGIGCFEQFVCLAGLQEGIVLCYLPGLLKRH